MSYQKIRIIVNKQIKFINDGLTKRYTKYIYYKQSLNSLS